MTIHRAHEDRVVHVGLRPTMILLADKTVHVGDWERARVFAEHRDTSDYDAPEQITGESVDERTDVYRLGAIAHFVVTSQPPGDEPPSKLNSEVSQQFDMVCKTAMATDPADRYQSVMKFDDMLRWAVFRG
ncbi:protein kinase domain-containing protein [Haladaptatus salinisoli]|uniref:protein kinase domain-containing protein n=1 Tax=Haladaptatus salinisoli TaxID=2884876 RepID=UPI001D0B6189|nr:hypothetical protein [Haladaptatus salinisoli]